MQTNGQAFVRLVNIMNELRAQCPWDRKQTLETLRTQTIEESYELTDALLAQDWPNIKEELGDVLLHLVFYSKIATEQNQFTVDEMIESLCNKLVRRHPHIYGSAEANDEETVKRNWESIKQQEGPKPLLAGVPKGLPALVKAIRIQEKAKAIGFEWDNAEQVWEKVEEETQELAEAVAQEPLHRQEEELGDLLFSLVNYSRFLGLDAERALEKTNQKFMKRFAAMELLAAANGQQLQQMNLAEMDALWNQVKHQQPAQ